MSYCVNCGVELHKTCEVCPLCNTKVCHPEQEADRLSPPPYPDQKGDMDPVQRSDMTILLSVVLAVTAVICGLLNLFVFYGTYWSLYVIGGCVLLWIFCLPVFFFRIRVYISLLMDGLGIALYFGMIALLHPGNGWYPALALPLVVLATGLILLLAVYVKKMHASVLSGSVLVLSEVSVFTVSVELLIDGFLGTPFGITWSAVVLTCCVVIDAALITIIRRSRLREEVRRRMHI